MCAARPLAAHTRSAPCAAHGRHRRAHAAPPPPPPPRPQPTGADCSYPASSAVAAALSSIVDFPVTCPASRRRRLVGATAVDCSGAGEAQGFVGGCTSPRGSCGSSALSRLLALIYGSSQSAALTAALAGYNCSGGGSWTQAQATSGQAPAVVITYGSVSVTASTSLTASVSPSTSTSASVSPSATASGSATASASRTATTSLTVSVSPSTSPSASATASASPSVSATPSATPSVSATPPATPSVLATASVSASASVTATVSPSPLPPPCIVYVADRATPTGSVQALTAPLFANTAVASGLSAPQSVTIAPSGNVLATEVGSIFSIPGGSGAPQKLATGWIGDASGLALAANGDIYYALINGDKIYKVPGGNSTPVVYSSSFVSPYALAISGADMYVGCRTNANPPTPQNAFITKIANFSSGAPVTSTIGSGFSYPTQIAVNNATGDVYVSDKDLNAVFLIPSGKGNVTTAFVSYVTPWGVALASNGDVYYDDATVGKVYVLRNGSATSETLASGFSSPRNIALSAAC